MIWKKIPGSTTKWFIDVIEARPGSLHSPIYVAFKKDGGEDKQIFLDSSAYLVDLLVREFEDGQNFIGVPPLTVNRATKAISDYFNLSDEFSSDLTHEYLRFLNEEGIPGPSVIVTAREIKELYERSANLKRKLFATDESPKEVLEEAIEHLESEDENTQEE